jgi:hypothetical protein
VDNTGNIRVWPTGSLLLYCLLYFPILQPILSEKKHILEIGAGQTGLAGLGLAYCGIGESIMLTDGHCSCNLHVCIEMYKMYCQQQLQAENKTASFQINKT